MTSPGGKEVGRISIRVVPDTGRFRADLQRQLDVIEKEVRGTVHVNLELDENGIRAKVKAATAGLDKTAKVKVTADLDGFQKRMLSDLSKAGSKIEAKIPLTADGEVFRRRVAAEVLRLERSLKIDIPIDTDPGLAKWRSSVASQIASLKSLGDAGDGAASIGKIGAGGFGSLMNPTLFLAVAAAATLLAPALALVSGVLVSLPALLAAVAIPIGAMALGLDGLKEAAKVLAPDFEALKKSMSGAVKDQFTPVFEKLKGIFPLLTAELPKVTKGLASMADAFISSVTSAPGMAAIKSTIGNIGEALTAASPGIKSFTDGMLGLISSVSEHLPGLSEFFNQFSDRFANWVAKVTKKDWFGNSPLSSAMGSLKDSLQGILDLVIKLGTKGIDMLSDPNTGKDIKKVFDSITTFVDVTLPQLNNGFHSLASTIDGIASQWNAIKWVIAPDQQIQTSLGLPNKSTFQQIGDLWTMTKAQVVLGFGEIVALAATLPSRIAAAWASLPATASTVWAGVSAAAQGALSGIAGTLASVPGILSSAWAGLSSIASTAWQGVVTAVQTAFAGVLAAVVAGVAQIVAEVAAMGGKLIAAVTGIDLSAAGKAIMDGFLGGIRAGFEAVKAFVGGIKQWIIDNKGPVSKDAVALTPAGLALMQGLQDGIEGGFQGVLSRARQLAQEISDAINSGGPIDASGLNDKLKKQMDEIGLQSDELKVQLNNTTDKDQKTGIRDQRTQLQGLRDQLNLQQDQLGFSQKYGESLDKNDNLMGDSLNKMVDAGKGFAEANVKQFMGDIGMSGNGAVPQVADQLLGWGSQLLSGLISGGGQTNIHVNSIDEGLAAKQTIQNKKSLQYAGR